jgi:hypothetical protein
MPVGKGGNNKNQFTEETKEPLLEVQRPTKVQKPLNNEETDAKQNMRKKKPIKNEYELDRLAAIKENENHDDEVIPSSDFQ